ncbi:MAG: EF-P beta-lysylation protein EpmB [Gammaproteobacteria bacterium]|nr:EF-P beta-lysylation protein EpmB [Gammaproteobacteria bacterium]
MPKSLSNSISPLDAESHFGWQQQLAQAITDPLQLLEMLAIDALHFPQCQQASEDFQLKVPQHYINKIEPGNPHDPLLKQVMASAPEVRAVTGFERDPVGDLAAMAAPGLLHKYQGRVLLVTTGACAVHCRYCFRRHFPYSQQPAARNNWQDALDYIRRDSSIHEVILSGGDPLVLSNGKLTPLLLAINDIPHVEQLRLHTRLPVMIPQRIDDSLLNLLKSLRLQTCMVIHANHAAEIADDEIDVLHKLRAAGITLLNQSVLLKGINDSTGALNQLSKRLYHAGVLPYYLHLLDRVEGAAHFEVNEADAIALMQQLRQELPGYLLPRLVREIQGKKSKIPVFEL